jgi:hypothetical protein
MNQKICVVSTSYSSHEDIERRVSRMQAVIELARFIRETNNISLKVSD